MEKIEVDVQVMTALPTSVALEAATLFCDDIEWTIRHLYASCENSFNPLSGIVCNSKLIVLLHVFVFLAATCTFCVVLLLVLFQPYRPRHRSHLPAKASKLMAKHLASTTRGFLCNGAPESAAEILTAGTQAARNGFVVTKIVVRAQPALLLPAMTLVACLQSLRPDMVS